VDADNPDQVKHKRSPLLVTGDEETERTVPTEGVSSSTHPRVDYQIEADRVIEAAHVRDTPAW